MSPEMTVNFDGYENNDIIHHYPGHVDEDNVEVEVVEDNSENDKPAKFSKNKATIPWEIGMTVAAKQEVMFHQIVLNLENLNFMIWMTIWIGNQKFLEH